MASIDMVAIDNIENRWGVKAGDYNITINANSEQMDFQDLLVKFSKNRAIAVEGEVEPLTVRIQQRNKRLDQLGEVLAELTTIQADFESDDSGNRDMRILMTNKTAEVLKSLGYSPAYYYYDEDFHDMDPDDYPNVRPSDKEERAGFYCATWIGGGAQYSANKKTIEGMLSRVKSEIDGLNNEAQTDMTRLQSLVDRRDESYSTATNLMTSISDTRSNVIRNM